MQRREQAIAFVQEYLYRAHGHQVLAESVYAEGERRGFSEARLRRAGQRLGLDVSATAWRLPEVRAEVIDAERVTALERDAPPAPAVPAVPTTA